jgi:diguanylate cyclase (GGDEF)-like protein
VIARATPRSSTVARAGVAVAGLVLVVGGALVSADSARGHDQLDHDHVAQLRARDRAEAVARAAQAQRLEKLDQAVLAHALEDGYVPGPIRLVDTRTGRLVATTATGSRASVNASNAGDVELSATAVAAVTRPGVVVDGTRAERFVASRVVQPGSQVDWAVVVPVEVEPLRVQDLLSRDSVAVVAIGLLLLLVVFLNARNARRTAERDALVDALTGASSREGVARFVDEALARRNDHSTVTVLHAELDGLAELHGALGHAAASELLRQVAQRLVAWLPSAHVGRLDGATFALACEELRDHAEAVAFAEMVHDLLHEPIEVDGLQLGVEAHVGVVVGPEHGLDASVLLRRADLAAQRARAAHEPVVLFERPFDNPTPERLALVADLRRAVDDDQLFLNYQPIVHMLSGEVVGFEALVRWHHPTRGVLLPGEFVPLAEPTALVHPLTARVLDEAMRQCSAWCEAGSYIPIAVNVSARCLSDDGFAMVVEDAMNRWNVPPHLLEIELTESAVMDDPTRARRVLAQLHRLGVNIAIDDFGTGHSSLAYLQSLPVDTLKIDASFVQQLGHRPGEGTIVRSIVGLARTLGLQVVAEGVDDDHALRFLVEVGCDLGQGYRWAQPMDGHAALALARACALSSDAGGRDRSEPSGD